MNYFRRLLGMFVGATAAGGRYRDIYVLSHRCNEPLAGQVDLVNELSRAEEDEYFFYSRKVLHTTGESRCFAQVEVHLYFDRNKNIVHHEVSQGRWLTAEEYDEELARFNAPPEDEEDDYEADDEIAVNEIADNDAIEETESLDDEPSSNHADDGTNSENRTASG